MFLSRLFLVLTLLSSTSSFAWTNWVGVLEDWPVESAEKISAENQSQDTSDSQLKQEIKTNQQYEARARPLFVRVDKNPWQAAPQPKDQNPSIALPKAFSWDICIAGRSDGQLTAMLSNIEGKPNTPPYLLRADDRAPWRTKRSADYAGWLETPVYKPILLKSSLSSGCNDPQKWRQAGSEKSRPHLKKLISELNKKMAEPTNHTDFYQFNEKDVRIHRTWVSPKHGLIVALQTIPKSRKTETFRIMQNNEAHHLGSDMMLIDAGDFDGDGETEMLFKRHIDKKDIYDLYSDTKLLASSVWE